MRRRMRRPRSRGGVGERGRMGWLRMTGTAAGTRGRIQRIEGSLRVPGDKSISHRALLFAAIATAGERSRIRHILDSADVRSTAGVLRALGVAIPAGPLRGEIE